MVDSVAKADKARVVQEINIMMRILNQANLDSLNYQDIKRVRNGLRKTLREGGYHYGAG